MKVLPITAGLLLALAAPAHAVVGGDAVPAGQHLAVANVSTGGSPACTGELIAPGWILTAGHCASATGSVTEGLADSTVTFPPSAFTVTLGTVDADGSGGETHAVDEVLENPMFSALNGAYAYDTALLHLSLPSAVAPLRLAADGERASWEPGQPVQEVGFGTTSEDDSTRPPTMREVTVPVVDDATCSAAYPNDPASTAQNDGEYEASVMLCAGLPQGGKDTCDGDSGGPLLAFEPGGEQRIVGTTSTGNGCAKAGFPGIAARVAADPLRAWIEAVVPEAVAPEPVVPVVPAPLLTRLALHPRRFRARTAGPTLLPARAAGGARLTLLTRTDLAVRVTIARLRGGKALVVARATAQLRAGSTTLTLTGRGPGRRGHRALPPGRYLLRAAPVVGGTARSTTLRILG